MKNKPKVSDTVTLCLFDGGLGTRWLCCQVMSKDWPAIRQSSCNGLGDVLDRLQACGWYWGAIDNLEAMRKLRSTDCGTFLLRDSTDSRHLFTLSVRTTQGMTSVRLLFKHGRFTLDSVDPDWSGTPSFDCVLKLIYYYMRVSNNQDGRCVFAIVDADDEEDRPLILKKPLFQTVPTLKHLCRRVINTTQPPEDLIHKKLPIPLEHYLLKYPYPI